MPPAGHKFSPFVENVAVKDVFDCDEAAVPVHVMRSPGITEASTLRLPVPETNVVFDPARRLTIVLEANPPDVKATLTVPI